MTDDVAAFRHAAAAAYGRGWVYRLHRAAGVGLRTAQRWAAGTNPPPPGVLADVEAQAAAVEAFKLGARVASLERQALAAGVGVHALAGALRDRADRLLPPGKGD